MYRIKINDYICQGNVAKLKTNNMETTTIINIIKGYENQLANAEIKNETANIKFLKEQINEGHKMIAQFGTYSN